MLDLSPPADAAENLRPFGIGFVLVNIEVEIKGYGLQMLLRRRDGRRQLDRLSPVLVRFVMADVVPGALLTNRSVLCPLGKPSRFVVGDVNASDLDPPSLLLRVLMKSSHKGLTHSDIQEFATRIPEPVHDVSHSFLPVTSRSKLRAM